MTCQAKLDVVCRVIKVRKGGVVRTIQGAKPGLVKPIPSIFPILGGQTDQHGNEAIIVQHEEAVLTGCCHDADGL